MQSGEESRFLLLPAEIRDQIIGEVLFPGEKEPIAFNQDTLGLAATAVRQIFPHDKDKRRRPRFDVAIIRTCRQLQTESEAILYGSSSWNLMYQDWNSEMKLSYEFLEKLPTRLRRMIHRVERKCFSAPYKKTISLTDWKIFMTFLARECPNLKSLKLWGPGDRREGPPWVDTCDMEEEWVRAILQIKSLVYFDIPVIKNGIIYEIPYFADEFLPELKRKLLQQSSHHFTASERPMALNTRGRTESIFRLLDLDVDIRERIYRHLLLPPDRRLHPYIGAWYDQTTKNTVSLFLTCRQVHKEAEKILYSRGVFSSPIKKYDVQLLRFFRNSTRASCTRGLNPRLLSLVRQVYVGHGPPYSYYMLAFMAEKMNLESLQIFCDDETLYGSIHGGTTIYNLGGTLQPGITFLTILGTVRETLTSWSPSEDFLKNVELADLWQPILSMQQLYHLARIRGAQIETPLDWQVHPACLSWPTVGLRNELLHRTDFSDEMQWLHNGIPLSMDSYYQTGTYQGDYSDGD